MLSTAHPSGTQPPQPCCPASPTFEIQTRSRLSVGTKPTVPGRVSLQNAKPRVRLGILYTNCLHSSSQRLTAHEHSIPFQRVKLDLDLCTAGVLWPRLPVSLWPPCQSEGTLVCPLAPAPSGFYSPSSPSSKGLRSPRHRQVCPRVRKVVFLTIEMKTRWKADHVAKRKFIGKGTHQGFFTGDVQGSCGHLSAHSPGKDS